MVEIRFEALAARQRRKLPPDVRAQIDAKLMGVAAGRVADVRPLVGAKGVIRLRVGPYRVIFERNAGAMVVLAIGHRREVYR